MNKLWFSFFAFLAAGNIVAAEPSTITIGGTIVNHKGHVFTNVTVYGIGTIESRAAILNTKSDIQGKWQLNVPPGNWLIRVDPDELIVRGYSCFPDWNEWVFRSVTNIVFEVIPTRPIFGVPKLVEEGLRHTITFDTTTVAPVENVRTYNVQQTIDQIRWTTIASISLTNSPIEITDPEAMVKMKFYRAVLVNEDN
jgi:hypothetical protein